MTDKATIDRAREICARHAEAHEYPSEAAKYRSGEYDDNAVMRASIAAYERADT